MFLNILYFELIKYKDIHKSYLSKSFKSWNTLKTLTT